MKSQIDQLMGYQDLHIIRYTKQTDISQFTDPLIIQYAPVFKVFHNQVELAGQVVADIEYWTSGSRKPSEYYGINVGSTIDPSWPPQIEGFVYVSDNKSLLLQQDIKTGSFVVTNGTTYLIRHTPIMAPYNWIPLGEPPVTSGPWWNDPTVGIDKMGVSELGQYLDFHNTYNDGEDYSYRISNIGNKLIFSGDATIIGLTTTNLISPNATINNLTNTNSTIENATIANVTIDTLTSTNATIDDLSNTTAIIDTLTSTNATIDTLTSTNATITSLVCDDSNIDTLTNRLGTIETLNTTDIIAMDITTNNLTVNGTFTGSIDASQLTGIIDITNLPLQDIIDAVNAQL